MIKSLFHFKRRLLAGLWLNVLHPDTIQIGITGSYGKTSTTTAIAAVLSAHAPTLVTDLNLDTIYNVPITALKLRRERYLVFELGIDQPNEMDFHLEITRPSIGVVTGISPVHSDRAHLGSLEAIVAEKRKLIEALPADGTAVLNADDEHVRAMAGHTRARVVWYGRGDAQYTARDIRTGLDGTRFDLQSPEGIFPVQTGLLGEHSALNLAAAAAVCRTLGVPWETIQQAFTSLKPLTGRLSVEPGPLGTILINDALRANPASTAAGLAFLASLADPPLPPPEGGKKGGVVAGTRGKKIAVLGEMGELGDLAIEKHEEIGRLAAETRPDLLITVGVLTDHIARVAREAGLESERIQAVPDVAAAAEVLRRHASAGDLIYLKGSLMRHLERIPLILAGEKVVCRAVVCPFYHQCPQCEYLEIGYEA